jgi:hypothetical protein
VKKLSRRGFVVGFRFDFLGRKGERSVIRVTWMCLPSDRKGERWVVGIDPREVVDPWDTVADQSDDGCQKAEARAFGGEPETRDFEQKKREKKTHKALSLVSSPSHPPSSPPPSPDLDPPPPPSPTLTSPRPLI